MKTVRASLVGFGLGVVSFFILGAIWSPGDSPLTARGGPLGFQPLAMGSQGLAQFEDVFDHTFSIVAMDPETGEVGVAVTTRNACVGNRVPWVRTGVGAVATQASTRPDGQSVFLNVCEHPEPVTELRRQFQAVSQTLGYRTLEEFVGSDVWQLRVMLHALGFFGDDREELPRNEGWNVFTPELALAVDRFREARGHSTAEDGSPSGLVDGSTVKELWRALEEGGRAVEIRKALRGVTHIRN